MGDEVLDRAEARGREQGIQQGIQLGIQQGILLTLVELVRMKIITTEQAAEQASMSKEEFEALMPEEE